jgi:hypothetical protein
MSARSAMSMRMYFSNFFSISANRIHARPRPDDVRTFRRQRTNVSSTEEERWTVRVMASSLSAC